MSHIDGGRRFPLDQWNLCCCIRLVFGLVLVLRESLDLGSQTGRREHFCNGFSLHALGRAKKFWNHQNLGSQFLWMFHFEKLLDSFIHNTISICDSVFLTRVKMLTSLNCLKNICYLFKMTAPTGNINNEWRPTSYKKKKHFGKVSLCRILRKQKRILWLQSKKNLCMG